MSSNLVASDDQSQYAQDGYTSSINSSLASPALVEEGQDSHDRIPFRRTQEPVLIIGQDQVENKLNEQPALFVGVKTPTPQVLEVGLESPTTCHDKDIQEVNIKYQKPDAVFPILQLSDGSVQTVENVDEVNSEAQEPQLVISTQIPLPPDGQAQSPVLSKPALTAFVKHQETSDQQSLFTRFEVTSVNSSEVSSNKSATGPCFEILEVKPNPTCTNSQQSTSQAKPNDNVDGQTNTTTKHPQQVADANQKTWGYMDLYKRQLQYNRPTRVNKVELDGGVSVIMNGQFPSFEFLNKEAGLLIYSTVRDLIAGEVYIKPQSEHYSNVLGIGGNGRVFRFSLRDRSYAVKLTRYRENELSIWSTLQHPNILPLLAVMIGEQYGNCYQFMPQMSGDLRSMMIKRGDLLTLLKEQPQKKELFLENIKYVITEIFKGLVYLEQQRIQHGDLKASNILVQKECECSGILYCKCVDKYTIKISDFDCAKRTKFARKPNQSSVCETSMTEHQMEGVKGTRFYRAPEQFKLCPSQVEYKKTLIDGNVLYDMEGPWCDVWSMGVILVTMTGKKHAVREACMLTNCKGNSIEPTSAGICLIELLTAALDQPELKPLAKLTKKCLTIDITKRPTAEEILSIPYFTTTACEAML